MAEKIFEVTVTKRPINIGVVQAVQEFERRAQSHDMLELFRGVKDKVVGETGFTINVEIVTSEASGEREGVVYEVTLRNGDIVQHQAFTSRDRLVGFWQGIKVFGGMIGASVPDIEIPGE